MIRECSFCGVQYNVYDYSNTPLMKCPRCGSRRSRRVPTINIVCAVCKSKLCEDVPVVGGEIEVDDIVCDCKKK